jgi:hypothetical protein
MNPKYKAKYFTLVLIVLIYQILITGCGGSSGGDNGNDNSKPINGSADFDERWESAAAGSYSPAANAPIINADEGDWIIGDTVSEFPDCGPTPHVAEIVSSADGKALRLTSNNSQSSCGDNIWVEMTEVSAVNLNSGFSIPITSNTIISFDQSGSLENPQSGSPQCITKPCGDTVSLSLADNHNNVLVYVFQRASDAQAEIGLSNYREIFLDTNGGSFNRDLYSDFNLIANFQANGAAIESIVFEVDDHGSATLDNLKIHEMEAPDNSGSVQVAREELFGIWRRTDPSHTYKGKEYLSNGTGWLGNFNSGPFSRATNFTWSLDGVRLTDNRVDGVRVEDIVYFDGSKMTTQRVDNGKFLNGQKQ